MEPSSILDLLREVFSVTLGVDGTTITRETMANDVDGWDSAANVLLLTATEKEFALRFKSRELAGFHCVGDMVDAIDKKINGK